MPIYEFACDSCGHEFEKIVSFSATQPPACPSCEAETVTRRMGRPAIHFKGSGWYITDSKKSKGSASSASANGSSTKSDDSSSSESTPKSESTPAAKSESSSEKATVKADA
ncbi:MAG: zinc ribbon domain-containing protein [Caldilineaceae bacterium]|nr:zinc ribbon domain-containing protein [Caldilineaceae bacterium]